MNDTAMETRLEEAFEDLREQGFLAERNFMCCWNCAGCELANRATELRDAGKPDVKGCVFYHEHDNEKYEEGRDFYISYGIIGTVKHGDIGLPTVEVGKLVVETFSRHGITTDWDGDGDARILVKAD